MLLLDTDVMIDVHRRYPPALEWIAGVRSEEAALPGLVVLELLDGAPNKRAAREIERFTGQFRIFWPTADDQERARLSHADARLAHSIGILDMLIAQTAIGLGVRLLTFNVKHYAPLSGLTIYQPYNRPSMPGRRRSRWLRRHAR